MAGTQLHRRLRHRHRRVGPRRQADRTRPASSEPGGRAGPRPLRRPARRPPPRPPTSQRRARAAARGHAQRHAARATRRRSRPPAGGPCSSRSRCAAIPRTPEDHVAAGRRARSPPSSAAHPGVTTPRGRHRHDRQGVRRHRRRRTSSRAELISLPITLVILVLAFGALVAASRAAAARPDLGRRRDGRARPRLAGRAERPVGRLARRAVRPRRRRRLLALLHPPRARGAPRGPRAPTPRSTRRPRPSAAPSSSPASR